jgi:transposase InsO family protein
VERLPEESSVKELCDLMGHGRASFYRWKPDPTREAERPGPKGPQGEVLEAMRQIIREKQALKRNTWGVEVLYEEFDGVIPKSVIAGTIEEERRRKDRAERESATRYEISAPDAVWSEDFIDVKPKGRVLRVQDECSRFVFGTEHRDSWREAEVARFVAAAMERYGKPLFFKHDLGTEFTSGTFQALLRGSKVIAFPNPPRYPKYNGKHERTNAAVRFWLARVDRDLPTVEDVLEEMKGALLDLNFDRPKEVLGGRTPEEVYRIQLRAMVDREVLYSEWDDLYRKLATKQLAWNQGFKVRGEFQAMRIAALVVLKRYDLVRYPGREPEGPKV